MPGFYSHAAVAFTGWFAVNAVAQHTVDQDICDLFRTPV